MSLIFLIAVPLLAPIVATGFGPDERAGLGRLAWYFAPWTLVCIPYYAAAARYKKEWRFNRVFFAEIVVVVASIGSLVLWHEGIRLLPLAYASGYGAGLALLAVGAGLWRQGDHAPSPPLRGVLRNIGELFLANQSGSVSSLVDRHIQSFLVAGGIGALNYSMQITASLSSLLTLRDIYMVPLTQQAERAERLERLISGLLLLSVPLSGFVACFAPDLVTVLLQRGRFDATAAALTTQALRISALTLATGSVFLPLLRMFQILDRIRLTYLLFLLLAVEYAVFGYILVVALGMGVSGVAMMQLAGSTLTAIIAGGLLGHCGIRPRWRRPLGYLGFAALASVAACVVAALAASKLDNVWLRLAVGGTAYGLVVLLCYFLARGQLHGIVFGLTPPTDQNRVAGPAAPPTATLR